jgi:hypothetical protein
MKKLTKQLLYFFPKDTHERIFRRYGNTQKSLSYSYLSGPDQYRYQCSRQLVAQHVSISMAQLVARQLLQQALTQQPVPVSSAAIFWVASAFSQQSFQLVWSHQRTQLSGHLSMEGWTSCNNIIRCTSNDYIHFLYHLIYFNFFTVFILLINQLWTRMIQHKTQSV